MAGIEFRPTRMELLAFKRRLKLAQRGLELLREKQDALIMEFFAVVQKYRKIRDSISSLLSEAYHALANAEIEMGALKLERISEGIPETIKSVNIKTRNIMGVSVPVIEAEFQTISKSYCLIDTSVYLETVSEKFSQLLPLIIKLADVSATLTKLAEEIKKVRRRVNALENIIIPRLNSIINYIEFYLEEREREDIFRFKRIKKKLEAKS
ncbi:MAG: V-type ATP synthase subunit D [Candidatus Methanomethylicia archaeon]|nr:V-type ATP synthase subunit D [Candidatus Methanomethylicia archaeon]MCX8169094.1 V-type ATP synthase subunit D [Candidatus Methanomethylicia archaeon]MDW7988826.1 V-type ATP synthase subunit D [Nitrososphaerota archaeon]